MDFPKIVSGGQTGADRAALDWAIANCIPHSGWCPAGRLAEDGPIDTLYNLMETPKAEFTTYRMECARFRCDSDLQPKAEFDRRFIGDDETGC